jgi:hypothetical protein
MENLPQKEISPHSRGRTAALILALITGLGAAFLTVTFAACGLGMALIQRRSSLSTTALPIVSLVAAGLGLGLPLAWQAFSGLSGKPSGRLRLSRVGGLVLILVYALAVAGGQAVLDLRPSPLFALPPFHVAALTLPPLLLLWGAASLVNDQQFTWRQAWGGLGGGAFGAVGLAFLIEAVLLALGVALAVAVTALSPEGGADLRNWRPTPGDLADPALLRSLLRNPAVVLGLLASVSVIVPLIEEPAKSLVPALAGAWQTPTVNRLFLWGVASGAGFALFEGVVNGGLNTEQWGLVALLRVGSSAMHCLAAGLTGWGWGQVWTRRKWRRLLLASAGAIAMHGLWNAVSIGMVIASEGLDGGAVQNALVAASTGLLVFLTLGAIMALTSMAKRLSTQGAAPQLETTSEV